MRILSIETSCDETAVALLEINGELVKPSIKILGNTIMSQIHLHEKYGGVYPNLAKREHQKNLPILLEKTLDDAGYKFTKDKQIKNNDIDVIAVTNGPGLEPALWVGVNFAEELGKKWNKPVVPVNHMEGHIFSVLHQDIFSKLQLPALALLVSGGHTELVHVKDFGNYEIVGQTRDDAVGEAFDKVARMLGLSYPGGPKISALAEKARGKRKAVGREFPDALSEQTAAFRFPRPMINSKDLDFSFSGLKTAVLYKIKSVEKLDDDSRAEMAKAFEDAAVEVLVAKTQSALLKLGDEVKTLIVAGGVSANNHLVKEIKKLVKRFPNIILLMPEKSLATDNAVMIGIAAFIKISLEPGLLRNNNVIKAQGNLSTSSSRLLLPLLPLSQSLY